LIYPYVPLNFFLSPSPELFLSPSPLGEGLE